MSKKIVIGVSPAQKAALNNAPTTPSAANPFITQADAGAGSGAPTIILPFIQNNSNSTTYATLGSFIFPGSAITGALTEINALVRRNAAATSVSLRIYDVTNAQVIAELTGITNLDDDVISDLGVISNLPVGEAKFDIQGLRVSVGGGARVFFNGLEIRL